MRVVVEESVEGYRQLELGDVVQHNGETYLVIECRGKYLLRSMDGIRGLCGIHGSLADLVSRFNTRERLKDAIVYKSSEYEMVLRKKGDN